MKPAHGARLDVWHTDPGDRRRVPAPGSGGVLFGTMAFALKNSGNRTLRAPKRSWRIILDPAVRGNRLAEMTRINLKAMYNDPSQMREALAWRLFGTAGIPAPRHTYAKLAFDNSYRGLFSVIEHVDKKFLRDHFGKNYRGNLYKTGYRDIGGAHLEYRTGRDGDDSGRQYFIPGSAERTYRLQTNKNNPEANTLRRPGLFHQDNQRHRAARRRGTFRYGRLPRVGGRHHERHCLPEVGGRQHAARELGQLLRVRV